MHSVASHCTDILRQPPDGLEPSTCGLQNRCPESGTDDPATTYDEADQALTALLTDIARIEPDLASVVRAWPTLSELAKADVLTVINASQQRHSATECK